MVKDLSRHTIIALVALTVVVSLLGTLTVYSEVVSTQAQRADEQSTSSGYVRVTVVDDNDLGSQSTSSAGEVRLEIER